MPSRATPTVGHSNGQKEASVTRILHIACSPRENSQSRLVAEALLETYTATRPNAHVDVLDLWDLQLPEMREDVLNAKYAIFARREHTAA